MVNEGPKPRLVLAGQFQRGKSTFVNCLLRGKYAIEGNRTRTTAGIVRYVHSGDDLRVCTIDKRGFRRMIAGGIVATVAPRARTGNIEVSVPSDVLMSFDVLDTPGWGGAESDDKIAVKSLEDATLVVYIVSRSLDESDCEFLRLIQKERKYYAILLNCQDKENPSPDGYSQNDICRAIVGKLKQNDLLRFFIRYPSECGIAVANLKWTKYAIGLLENPQNENEENQLDEVINRRKELKDLAGDKIAALKESRFEDVTIFVCHAVSVISKICGEG